QQPSQSEDLIARRGYANHLLAGLQLRTDRHDCPLAVPGPTRPPRIELPVQLTAQESWGQLGSRLGGLIRRFKRLAPGSQTPKAIAVPGPGRPGRRATGGRAPARPACASPSERRAPLPFLVLKTWLTC